MTPLHHSIEGPPEGPVLLMGGSLGTTLDMWERQLPLAALFRLVRFDHRGHGRSPVPSGPYEVGDLGRDVLELMDVLGLDRASYLGLSLGGMVGMWLGANAAERIDRLVLMCTLPYMPPASMWRERAATVRQAGSAEPIADAVLARWLTPAFAEREPDVRETLRTMLVETSAEGYAACCGAIERMDLRPDLQLIGAPTLVISGADDLSTPAERMQLIASAVPGARHTIVGPAAHLAAIEQADTVNDLILEHLSMSDEQYERGMRVRREVLGDAHVDRAVERTTELTAPFQEFITRYAWGGVWSRPGLDRRMRSAVTLAVLTALGREHELELHLRAALRNGLTREEIGEVLLHTAVYAGVPAANAAFAVAQRVLGEDEVSPADE
jgi:3-oxoadipate enol-lactonase / 4-carboxymuconolactone decarboxylase